MTSSKRGELLPFQAVIAVSGASIAGIVAMLGELRGELGFTEGQIGITVAFGFLGSFLSQISLSRFADQGHARIMATVGVAVGGLGMIALAVFESFIAWSVLRAVIGFAGGMTTPGLRRAASVLDPENAGENLGRLVAGEMSGWMLGPLVAALLALQWGFRAPFLVFGVAMLLFVPLVLRLPPDRGSIDTSRRKTSFDLLRTRRLQGALLLVVGYFGFIGAWESVVPVMFTDRGGSPLTTGFTFTLLGIPMILFAVRAGRTADRYGPPRIAIAALFAIALTTMTYGLLPGLWPLVLVMGLAGVFDAFGFTANHVAVSRSVPEGRQAAALGLMGATQVLAAGITAYPAALLFERTGERTTWIVVGLGMIAMIGLAAQRFAGTEPVAEAPPRRLLKRRGVPG